MKRTLRNLCGGLMLLIALQGRAQTPTEAGSADTARVLTLIDESTKVRGTDADRSLKLATDAHLLASQIGFSRGDATALKNIGIVHYFKGRYVEALEAYNQSLTIFRSLSDNVGIANLLSNIGVVYYDRGDDTKALEFYLQALHHAELASDQNRRLAVLNNIGGIYFMKEETFDKALQYYDQALSLATERKDSQNIGSIAVNMGSIHFNKKNDEKALAYFNMALKAYGKSEASLNALNAIGKMYRREGKFELAIRSHEKALAIAENNGNKIALVQTNMDLGNVYKDMANYDVALSYFQKAEVPGKELDAGHELMELYKEMAATYASTNDFRNAFKYQTLFTEKTVAQYNADNALKQTRMQFSFDLGQKQTEINLLTKEQDIKNLELQRQSTIRNALLIGLGLILVIAVLLFRSYRQKERSNRLLDKQKAQIENLLLNILPADVAYELQHTGICTPKNYESVSVLFSDFKSFTTIADKMSPQELVAELNLAFMAFDEIIERHNLEKLKTIGDAYMCAGGIPTPHEGHLFNMVKAAVDIQEWVYQNNQRRKDEGKEPWEIRIGIHVGPLVAGVVGKKKYAYDIWGSTVNIASRMESNGVPGHINVSAAVYEQIRDQYACVYRGKIYAKNVGEIDMYLIDHEIESLDGFKHFEESSEPKKLEPARDGNLFQ